MVVKAKKMAFGMKKEKKPTAGSGNFQKLAGGVAKQYEAKGMSEEKAEKIGNAVAAKQGVKKFGQKAMTKAAVAGKKLETPKKPMKLATYKFPAKKAVPTIKKK